MEQFYGTLAELTRADWVNTAIAAVVILLLTALASLGCTKLIRRILKRSSLLPTSSIFVNITRIVVWVGGLSFLLSFCFNVNVSAFITALGIGGIAISLGFQDTLSNLIGGLQVSLSRIVEPGENIQMGANGVKGVISDVTWRHTTIHTTAGQQIIIPNSIMNTTALVKLTGPDNVSIPIVVAGGEQRLTAVAHRMEDAADKALSRVDRLKKHPQIVFTEVSERGFKGTLSFTLTDTKKITAATDAAIRAIAPFTYIHASEQIAADGNAANAGDADVAVAMDTDAPAASATNSAAQK